MTSSTDSTPYDSSDSSNTPTSSSPATSLASSPSTKSKHLSSSDDEIHLIPTLEKELPSNLPSVPKLTEAQSVAKEDVGTPDAWLNRDPRLIRLTGKHPFNCEPKLSTLFDQGFLTPSELFYVRNHGAVPKVDEEMAKNWRIEVTGQVKNPMSLSLQDLKDKFPTITLPVTLVCAGNRRKEQNVFRKGLGFNWGAAGVSTALFTGIPLSALLEAAQPIAHPETGAKAKHVVFEGADDLPQGRYGTSQLLSWAKDETRGMLIAWAMNGEPLTPDHGFPIRLVCPGQIGGRMVKWLTKIEVSHQESQHYLHFWDNKVLPTQVMPDEARSEKKWWYDPRYIINELNTNSAIAKPDHHETLELVSDEEEYVVKGYAYAGGGRRVNRVELSLDEGATWELAEIFYPEDLYRAVTHTSSTYGTLDLTERDTCFAWCFWSFKIKHLDLKRAHSISVRAMDEGLSGQPSEMYWNATSMMNNWYFRVAILHSSSSSQITFEHPTLAGVNNGGWMERKKELGENILQPTFKPSQTAVVPPPPVKKEEIPLTKEGVNRMISQEEFEAHDDPAHPWFVVSGQVYDGSAFLKDHPGGGDSILLVANQDATEDFMSIHSPQGKRMLADYHIGTLAPSANQAAASEAPQEEPITPVFLDKKKWKSGRLSSIKQVSPDSKVFRFELQSEEQALGLPTGQHVFVRLRRKVPTQTKPQGGLADPDDPATGLVQGELVQRAYTPVSPCDTKGHLDLLIKLYLPNESYKEGGKMSLCFNELVLGDLVEFKGPLGSFVWKGRGVCEWRGVERRVTKLGMICAGSGITPILQVLRGIYESDDADEEKPECWVIDSNRKEEDILCRDTLNTLSSLSSKLKVHHSLSVPPSSWPEQYSRGRITAKTLSSHLPAMEESTLILVCGPDGLISGVVKPGLESLGWNLDEQLVVF